MALKKGKLVNERFFWDDEDSGLFFDTHPIFRNVPGEDEDELNTRIDQQNNYITSVFPNRSIKTTLHLLDKQLNALPENKKLSWAAKTYLMIYRPGQLVADFDVPLWRDYEADLFLWSSRDVVFYSGNLDHLAHRCDSVSRDFVESFGPIAPTVPPVVIGGGGPTVPGTVVFPNYDVNLTGKILGIEFPIAGELIKKA